jgi:hypothetical protein
MLTVHFSHWKKGNDNLRGIPHIHILIRQRQGHNHGVLNFTKVFKYTGFFSVLGIRDILVWTRIRGSVPVTNGSGSNPFFSDFKDAENYFLHVT